MNSNSVFISSSDTNSPSTHMLCSETFSLIRFLTRVIMRSWCAQGWIGFSIVSETEMGKPRRRVPETKKKTRIRPHHIAFWIIPNPWILVKTRVLELLDDLFTSPILSVPPLFQKLSWNYERPVGPWGKHTVETLHHLIPGDGCTNGWTMAWAGSWGLQHDRSWCCLNLFHRFCRFSVRNGIWISFSGYCDIMFAKRILSSTIKGKKMMLLTCCQVNSWRGNIKHSLDMVYM